MINPNTYIFRFGMHKGLTFKEVAEKDPDYIIWCYDNIDGFELDAYTLEDLYKRSDDILMASVALLNDEDLEVDYYEDTDDELQPERYPFSDKSIGAYKLG